MKTYTDIEQSRMLAEILPVESADMFYRDSNSDDVKLMWEHVAPKVTTPCWSLAALLDAIKPINENTYTIRGTLDGGAIISFDKVTNVMFQEEEIIDAVFEMVVWLKEIGKLCTN